MRKAVNLMIKNLHISTLILSIMSLLFFVSCTKSNNDDTIKIGHVAPLTGNQAHLGKDNEAGFIMAISDLNKEDIIINGKPLVFEPREERKEQVFSKAS